MFIFYELILFIFYQVKLLIIYNAYLKVILSAGFITSILYIKVLKSGFFIYYQFYYFFFYKSYKILWGDYIFYDISNGKYPVISSYIVTPTLHTSHFLVYFTFDYFSISGAI